VVAVTEDFVIKACTVVIPGRAAECDRHTHTDEQANEHLEAIAKMRKALRKKQLMPMKYSLNY